MRKIYFLKGLFFATLIAGQAFVAFGQKKIQVKLSAGRQLQLQPVDDEQSLVRISKQKAAGKFIWVAHAGNQQLLAKDNSLQVLSKIAPGTFVVQSSVAPSAPLMNQWGIDGAGILEAPQKLSPQLISGSIPAHAKIGTDKVQLMIETFPGVSINEVRKSLAESGFPPEVSPMNNWNVFTLTCTTANIQQLASLPFVAYVQPIPAPDKTLNQSSRSMSRANSLQAPLAQRGRNLKGSGVTVGVGDDADPTLHPDLVDRIYNHTPGIVNDHGAHTTGTVAGAGNILPQRAGYAPMANVVSQWFSGILQNAATYVQDYNMVVTNNSYGSISGECDWEGIYDLQSKMLDEQAFTFPQLLHVFASGNDGTMTCSPYPNHYATVLGGYQAAKNVITTGRTDYTQLASSSSSTGPVKDGRLKPEIMALGEAIYSTTGNFSISNAYFASWGTSMASPAIAGGLTLLYERYKQLHSSQNPNGALMKGLLLNGARDLGTTGPDYRHGYGMMHLENSLRMLEANTYKQGQISQGASQDTVITVPAGTAQLKVMLYWHDPAANVLAAKALVNDLDLEVITPSSTTVLPLVLSTNPASVANAATNGVDHINNSEQVVINNPAAGNYTIRIRGYDVMVNAPQAYFVVFDYVPAGIKISVPFAGESWPPGGPGIPISWDYTGSTTGSFTLEYSTDGGSNWTLISNTIADDQRFYQWSPPFGIATNQALVRITKNGSGETFTTGSFSLLEIPTASLATATEQCEGYIKINWTAATGADGYDILMKQGAYMKTMASVNASALSYTLGGLDKDSTYYVSVRAVFGGVAGRWNTPVERKPNSGNCSGSISDGDLKIDSVTAPVSGRQFTSTALTASTSLKIRIKNLDDANATAFDIKYSINGAPFITSSVATTVAAGATYTHTINGLDFSATGDYSIVAVVKNTAATDAVAANDTFRTTVRHLANPAISLASTYTDGFESATKQLLQKNLIGIAGTNAWDYSNTEVVARLRTQAYSGIAHSGTKAITMDVSKATPIAVSPNNNLTGTFNLGTYTTTNEVRLDFWYKQHGVAQTTGSQNKVWARGNDAGAWVEVYDLGANQAAAGVFKLSSSVELNDLLANAGQNFSSSTQIRFGQFGLYGAADDNKFAGYTFDDVRLYLATNDLQLIAIDTPYIYSCGLSDQVPVRIKVRNSMSAALNNIPVAYSINGGSAVNEIISSIPANTTALYIFSTKANLSASGTYTITTSVNMPGDNVPENNQQSAEIKNQPVISSFPYFENFESSDGSWYAKGTNSSWQFGTPASRTINAAASGTKAWKTGLAGTYNSNELSYLYSPCFNINALTTPTLSFSMAYDLEDCTQYGVVCDAGWVEYSYDGVVWQKLGSSGSGTNWYDYASSQIWTRSNKTYWHVATIALPKQTGNISLRFVMSSDDDVNREGIAIDDIHIFDNTMPIYTGPTNSGAINQTVSGNGFIHFTQGGKVVASLKPNGATLGVTEAQAYFNTGAIRTNGYQYFANRNITVKPANLTPSPATTVRFYFTDAEVNELRSATGCASCKPPANYTKLNITKITMPDKANEDGTLDNNFNGTFSVIPNNNIVFVPYDAGYYAEYSVSSFSEFWLTDGYFNPPLSANWVRFDAIKINKNDAQLSWSTANESNVLQYEVEVSTDGNGSFVSLGTVAAKNANASSYTYTDAMANKKGTYYYRIKQIARDGHASYSATRMIRFGETGLTVSAYPNPVNNELMVVAETDTPALLQWKLTDAAGRIALQGKWQMNSIAEKWRINTRSLATGIYQLILNDGVKQYQQKVVKLGQ